MPPMIHAIFFVAVCISDQEGKLELKEDVMMMGGLIRRFTLFDNVTTDVSLLIRKRSI